MVRGRLADWLTAQAVLLLAAWTVACWVACSEHSPVPPPGSLEQAASGYTPPPNGALAPVYIDADFAQTFAIFVLRTLTPTEKSARWSHYYDGRWVRWIGELRYVTHDGLQLRQYASSEAY